MKKYLVIILILFFAIPVLADTEKVAGVSQPGKIMGMGWYTGTQVIGKVGGVTCSSPGCAPSYGSELATSANATDDGGGSETDATTGWSQLSSPSVFDSVDTAPRSGTYHMSVTADSSGDGMSRAISGLSASTMYKLSFYARHNGTASVNGEWQCFLAQSTTAMAEQIVSSSITKTDTTYAQHVKYFYFNARQDTITCVERNAANDGGIYLDDLSLKAVTSPCLGSELFTDGNAASIGNEANSVGSFSSTGLATFESSATSPDNGSYSLHMTANADGGRFYKDVSALMTTGKKYFASWKHKYGSGDGFGCGFASSSSMNFSIGSAEWVGGSSADTTWTHVGFSFVYDANHAYFGCKENGNNNNADIYIDTMSIKEITAE